MQVWYEADSTILFQLRRACLVDGINIQVHKGQIYTSCDVVVMQQSIGARVTFKVMSSMQHTLFPSFLQLVKTMFKVLCREGFQGLVDCFLKVSNGWVVVSPDLGLQFWEQEEV